MKRDHAADQLDQFERRAQAIAQRRGHEGGPPLRGDEAGAEPGQVGVAPGAHAAEPVGAHVAGGGFVTVDDPREVVVAVDERR